MKMLFSFVLICLCNSVNAQPQGISGQVFWLSGNQMPTPQKRTAGQGIQREIHIYRAATIKDAISAESGPFFSEVKTELVAKVTSAPDGTFKIKLPPGDYSVLIKEERGLFGNLYDSKGHINGVTVKPKEYTWVPITVDYEATY